MQTRSQTNLLLKKVEQNEYLLNQPLEKVVPNILLFKKVVPKLTLLKVDIDFDEASRLWKSNKKSTGNGWYKYICINIHLAYRVNLFGARIF